MKAFDLSVKRWLFCFTHPDDEISIVAWIKRLCDAGADVYCTWSVSNPIREAEARAMVGSLGVPQENMFFFDAPDGDACDHIPEIIKFARRVIEIAQPDRIAIGAFECGHIDHDSTNVAVAHANRQHVPMYEIPFYHTYLAKIPVINRFADPSDEEVIQLTQVEQALKVRAARAYESQSIGSNLFWYTVLNWAKLKPAALCKTERMRFQTHFEYRTPNLPKRLRGNVQASAKFIRFVRSAVYHESDTNWRVVQDAYLTDIKQDVESSFPEWKSLWTDEDDGLYLFFADFSEFMVQNIFDPEIGARLFDFINQAYERGSSETWELLGIQLFEPVYCNESLERHFALNLKGRALEDFQAYMGDWKHAQELYKPPS